MISIPNIIWNKDHHTEKPIDLMSIMVRNSTSSWDIVLDPFMWVWATCVACKKLNRKCIGIEIDEQYYNIAKDRIANASNELLFNF